VKPKKGRIAPPTTPEPDAQPPEAAPASAATPVGAAG
jgi:hypothetical protein